MVDFRFDESKSFAENCTAFLETLKSEDAEMAAGRCSGVSPIVQTDRCQKGALSD